MKQDSNPVMSNTVDKHKNMPPYNKDNYSTWGQWAKACFDAGENTLKKENEELKESIERGANQYAEAIGRIHELKERNRVLVEALDGLMERCISTIEGVGNFKIRHSNEFKAAKKAIESNQ